MARPAARICLARPPQDDKTGRGIARKQGWERDMALAPSVATSVDPGAAEQPGKGGGGTKVVLILAFAVFFLLGGVTNINDLLVGKFKPMFHLTHAEANLVQMAFFIAYGAFSIPAGIIMSKLGYIRTLDRKSTRLNSSH